MVVPSSNGGPQVCEIGDWKIPLRPHVTHSSVSPLSTLCLMGRLASFHAWPFGRFSDQEIFKEKGMLRNPKEL